MCEEEKKLAWELPYKSKGINQSVMGSELHNMMNQKVVELMDGVAARKQAILYEGLSKNNIDYKTLKMGRFKSLVLESYADGSSCYFYDNGHTDGLKIVTFTPLSPADLSFNPTIITQTLSFNYLIHEND